MTTMDYFSGRGMTEIIPDNWSPQNRCLGAKAKEKRAHTLTQGPDTVCYRNILFFNDRRALFL
jgi:hypothetical protein